MAIGIYFDGRRLIRPQAVTKIDDSGMYGRGLGGANILAVIGEATGGQPKKVQWFTDPSYAKTILRSGNLLKAIQRAYDPSSEVNGAYTVAAIRVNPAKQSELVLTDSIYNPLILVKSVDYGIWNNQIKVRIEGGTTADIWGNYGKKATVTYGANYDQGDLIRRNSIFLGCADPKATAATYTIEIPVAGSTTKRLTTLITTKPQAAAYPNAAGTLTDPYPTGLAFDISWPTHNYLYIGSDVPFGTIGFTVSVINTYAPTVSTLKYWDGTDWVAVTGFTDGTIVGTGATAKTLGVLGTMTFTIPTGWVKSATATGAPTTNFYWIRMEVVTSGTADAAITTTTTKLTDTRLALVTNVYVGAIITCNSKTMTITSNTATEFIGASWSGGGTPGNGNAWSLDVARLLPATAVTGITLSRGLGLNGVAVVDLASYPTIQELVDYLDSLPHYEAGVVTSKPDSEYSYNLDDAAGLSMMSGGKTALNVGYVSGTTLNVPLTTNFVIGDYITISKEDGSMEEARKVTSVVVNVSLGIDSALSTGYLTGSVVREAAVLNSNLQALIDWFGENTAYVTATHIDQEIWEASTAYVLGDAVVPTSANGYAYIVSVAGISGATEPSWTAGPVTDNTVTWIRKALTRGLVTNIGDTYMSGGTEGISTPTDWADCLELLQNEDANLVTCVTPDPAVWASLSTHCTYMSTVGKRERIGFCGGFYSGDGYTSGLGKWNNATNIANSINTMLAYALQLNSDRMVYVGPGFTSYDENGTLTTYNGSISAALVAGMAAGVDVAEALTHKSIKVIGLEYNFKWADLDRLLEGGICPLEYDPGRGYRVCQSITTWLRNDKYNRREVSVRRTADYVARQVRDRLEMDFVGTKGTLTTLISIKNATISVLTQMVRLELLAGDAANPPFKNIQVRLVGDAAYVDFECSPVIPINYIPVTIHLTVFTTTLTA